MRTSVDSKKDKDSAFYKNKPHLKIHFNTMDATSLPAVKAKKSATKAIVAIKQAEETTFDQSKLYYRRNFWKKNGVLDGLRCVFPNCLFFCLFLTIQLVRIEETRPHWGNFRSFCLWTSHSDGWWFDIHFRPQNDKSISLGFAWISKPSVSTTIFLEAVAKSLMFRGCPPTSRFQKGEKG